MVSECNLKRLELLYKLNSVIELYYIMQYPTSRFQYLSSKKGRTSYTASSNRSYMSMETRCIKKKFTQNCILLDLHTINYLVIITRATNFSAFTPNFAGWLDIVFIFIIFQICAREYIFEFLFFHINQPSIFLLWFIL